MHQTNLNPEATVNNTRAFPSITQPKIIGSFSVDADRRYIPSGVNLKFLNVPKPEPNKRLQLDLNEGFEIRQPKPASAKDEQIDHLLRFIIDNQNLLRERDPAAGRTLSTDFVCFRGLLRLLMCTPYERRTGWIVLATRYRGTVYLCAKDTLEKICEEANQTEQQKRFCYYGFKFEQHVLSDDPKRKPDTSGPVIESEEFCAMFSATLQGNRVLYGAEMDGIVSRDIPVDKRQSLDGAQLNGLEFVEVKVKRRESNQRQVDNFYRFKTRNWWCQSFLVNIGRVFVGLRDDGGIVDEVREFSLKELDRDSRQYWSASVCMAFCSQFLAMVKETMAEVDCKGTVYRFEYDSSRCRNVTYQIFEGPNRESFLPGWYCSEVK